LSISRAQFVIIGAALVRSAPEAHRVRLNGERNECGAMEAPVVFAAFGAGVNWGALLAMPA
jgi:hypothetical protein